MVLSTILGWAGMALILASYISISTKRTTSNSVFYQLLNFLGAAGIIVNSIENRAWPAAVLFIIWASMALVYLINIVRKTK